MQQLRGEAVVGAAQIEHGLPPFGYGGCGAGAESFTGTAAGPPKGVEATVVGSDGERVGKVSGAGGGGIVVVEAPPE